MRAGRVLLVVGLSVCGCSRPAGGDGASTAPSGSSQAPGAATPAAVGSAAASAAASASPAAATRTWKGEYKSTAAALAIPSDRSKVHWSDAPSTTGVGDGTLTVTVDGASGRATGEVSGPLGPANVEGLVADGKLTAAVRRKDPTDRGFTGTLSGAIAGDKVDGTMSVSLGQASSLRSATFSLAPEASR
jgi:hypothetical protein